MKVRCISGDNNILIEGKIYTVSHITENGNFFLEEVQVPEPYTSFSSTRFEELDDNLEDHLGWTDELEEEYWSEQPSLEYTA